METTPAPVVADTSAAKCPIDHTAFASAAAAMGGCPVAHGGSGQRSTADLIARRVLRISERPAGVTSKQAYAAFQKSMLISATRCTLTYVIFPFVLPAIGIVGGFGPLLGVIIGSIAIVSDVFAVRRFHVVEHKFRWHFTAIAALVIALLAYLLVEDVVHLLT
ncbi:MAG: hypothetical protein KDB40_04840 [Acidimicrobiales bacterium]|nr:hypothetical protein [Acidimicrobiales bacterium]MCB9394167.1 hypothetical protein [Acidimicrobiaceae bacterium]